MDDKKKLLEDMKIKYVSSNDEKEYAVAINRVKQMTEEYLTCSDAYGGYLGIDLVTGEITKERLEDGIPQPYMAGTATPEALNMIKETISVEKSEDIKIENKEMNVEQINDEQMGMMQQLMELLEQQNMREQTPDFMEMCQYMAGMQLQLQFMAEELHGVKEQLQELQGSQPKAEYKSLTERMTQLEDKINSLVERLSGIKDHLIDTAAQAIQAFKEKGHQSMNAVLQKGVSGAQKMLSDCREQMAEVKMNYEKTANQIDSIGDEIKQIGNSVANVGRLVAGKGTQEVSEEKVGVALTRAANAPVKKGIATLQKGIDRIDQMCEKLEQKSAALRPEQEKSTEKETRTSVKDRLSQMKTKSEQQKKKPEPEKAPAKAACL